MVVELPGVQQEVVVTRLLKEPVVQVRVLRREDAHVVAAAGELVLGDDQLANVVRRQLRQDRPEVVFPPVLRLVVVVLVPLGPRQLVSVQHRVVGDERVRWKAALADHFTLGKKPPKRIRVRFRCK